MVNREMILPIGVGAYVGKISLVGFVVYAISDEDWSGFTGLVWGLVAGTAMWMAGQVVWSVWQGHRGAEAVEGRGPAPAMEGEDASDGRADESDDK